MACLQGANGLSSRQTEKELFHWSTDILAVARRGFSSRETEKEYFHWSTDILAAARRWKTAQDHEARLSLVTREIHGPAGKLPLVGASTVDVRRTTTDPRRGTTATTGGETDGAIVSAGVGFVILDLDIVEFACVGPEERSRRFCEKNRKILCPTPSHRLTLTLPRPQFCSGAAGRHFLGGSDGMVVASRHEKAIQE